MLFMRRDGGLIRSAEILNPAVETQKTISKFHHVETEFFLFEHLNLRINLKLLAKIGGHEMGIPALGAE